MASDRRRCALAVVHLNTVAGTTSPATPPGWLWAAGTYTVRSASVTGSGGPDGYLLEASMPYLPAIPSAHRALTLVGGAR